LGREAGKYDFIEISNQSRISGKILVQIDVISVIHATIGNHFGLGTTF
jgi:hypothetical protein